MALKKVSKFVLPEIYEVEIDYSMSFNQMVIAGRYDTVDKDITADHFPIMGTGIVKARLRLINFIELDIRTADARSRIKKLGFKKFTNIEHLLAFGAKFPDKQGEFTIVAPHPSWYCTLGQSDVFPCLGEDPDGRSLYLTDGGSANDLWDDKYYFLVVSDD